MTEVEYPPNAPAAGSRDGPPSAAPAAAAGHGAGGGETSRRPADAWRRSVRGALFALLASTAPAFASGLEIDVAGEADGTVTVDLFENVAPLHVERIIGLARSGAYDGIAFHRVIDGFMAQTGDVQCGVAGASCPAGTGGSDMPNLPAEFSDINYDRGVIGMARARSPDSANSQFFIMFAEGSFLNGQYTVVGRVTGGMDVVDAIKRGAGGNGSVLGEPDRMTEVRVTE